MDAELARLVDLDTPKLNPVIAEGLAVSHMQHAIRYVDDVMRSAAKGFPEGLTYEGCERCTPQEEFDEDTKMKTNRRVFDVARSDVFMMKYHFKYRGVALPPRHLYLPFVGPGGSLMISGSRFNISPILSDWVISVGVTNIFVLLLRARLTFERMQQHYMEDGERQTVHVAWSTIYHQSAKMKKMPKLVKANSTLMHYLLCKYGFTETFLRFGKCRPIVGGAEINRDTYPESEWVICSTSAIRAPKTAARGFYQPSTVRVAIRRDEMTPMVRSMIGGFFYIVDHFPTRVMPDYVDEKRLWMVLMGHILFSGTINEGKLYDDIQTHIGSLDEYLDVLVQNKLKEINIHVDDIYQFFAVVIDNFNTWLLGATDRVASMYDKELSILYYILYGISSSIFKLYFKLKAASKKESLSDENAPKKDLTAEEIITKMNQTLRTGLIFSITRGHGGVSNISVPGDNKAFKVTSLLVPQSRSSHASNRKGHAVMNDPAKRLHVSFAEIGGYSSMPKAEPSGQSRLNRHVIIDAKAVVQRNPKHIQMLDEIQEAIRH